MSTKKLLVHEDKTEINKTIYCLEQFIPEMNKLKTAFENLKIGSFSSEIYNSVKQSLSDENMIQLYYESVNKELDKVGIENAITRASLLKAHENTIEQFKTEMKRFFDSLNTSFGMVDLRLLDYQGGKFFISNESVTIIRERNSYYLETKEEIELFNSLNELLKSMQKTRLAMTDLIGYEYPDHISTIDLIKKYFIFENNKTLTLKPVGIREFKRNHKSH
ncbi:hypothetical protein GCM10022386_21870 [Flavobacterium cheonhonense]|uniref:Uncharacterized protein n=1 Tax=Flavobacterium cheonhonense TaxID=706185 RepID=A0ABP7U4V4_9FLAO|nr:hypothetical protein [Flavobacterium cheonhonense]